MPFALYNPRSSSWILTPREEDRLEKHKEYPGQYQSTRDGAAGLLNIALSNMVDPDVLEKRDEVRMCK